MATEAEIAAIRVWVGDQPDDGELDDRLTRLRDTGAVALEVLGIRHANMIHAASEATLNGDVSVSFVANMKALERRMEKLAEALLVRSDDLDDAALELATAMQKREQVLTVEEFVIERPRPT